MFITRKQYDQSLPHGKAMEPIKRKWSLGGVIYSPKNKAEISILNETFNSYLTRAYNP